MVFHLYDALKKGHTSCLVRTVDTDVIVILIGKYYQLCTISPAVDIWVAFGVGRKFQYIHINTLARAIGKDISIALPAFHSFTGCDSVSSFFGRGKRLAWEAWKCYPDVTDAFRHMADNPFCNIDKEDEHFKLLERYTVVLYDKTSQVSSVNVARKEMFCQRSKCMETIPPTQSALLEHSKRAAYQTGIWVTCNMPLQHAPSPEGRGWTMKKESQSWIPVWTTMPMASKACSELVKCGCQSEKGCSGRCVCKKAQWKCTNLCSCKCNK